MRVVVIHGTFGNPSKNWLPWLADEVDRRGATAVVPAFPTPDGQSLSAWLEVAVREVEPLTSEDVLIGHSLGAGFALRLLERAQGAISGLFLVSGFAGRLGAEELDHLNASFVEPPFDWGKLRSGCDYIRLYNGDDDPFVPLEKGEELAAALGTSLTVVPAGGHINEGSGFTSFPQLLADLETLLPLSG
jgi:predicted alpha/beta hydrolase family esterase